MKTRLALSFFMNRINLKEIPDKETYTTERGIRLNFNEFNQKYAISHKTFYKIFLNFFLISKFKDENLN